MTGRVSAPCRVETLGAGLDRMTVGAEVDRDVRLVADHPGVVPGLDDGDVTGAELGFAPVVVDDV